MIVVREDVGIKSIRDFCREVVGALRDSDEVLLDFERVKRIDLSVAQVLLAAGRDARRQGKSIKLKNVSDHIRHQMHICGMKA